MISILVTSHELSLAQTNVNSLLLNMVMIVMIRVTPIVIFVLSWFRCQVFLSFIYSIVVSLLDGILLDDLLG